VTNSGKLGPGFDPPHYTFGRADRFEHYRATTDLPDESIRQAIADATGRLDQPNRGLARICEEVAKGGVTVTNGQILVTLDYLGLEAA
jgi:hypothetical protein